MAFIPPDVLKMLISVSSDIQAKTSVVSNVSSSSLVPLHELSWLLSEVSNLSISSDVETIVSLKNVSSVNNSSDSLSSPVKDEPLISIVWIVINEFDIAVDVSSDWSLGLHSGSDLEFDTIFEWISWVRDSLGINLPCLPGSVLTSVPTQVSVVRVVSSNNVEASNTDISDVLSSSIEPSDSLDVFSGVSSNNSSVRVSVPVVVVPLDGNGHLSVSLSSDRSGSPVEHPPLFDVFWIVVSDSKSIVVSSDVFMVENSSVSSHLRFDLESDSISQWISWEVNSSSVSEPFLVVAVFAHPESDVVLVGVSSISWHQTEVSMVDNSLSSEENLLIWLVFPWSDVNIVVLSMFVVDLIGECIVSSCEGSDGLGSVINEPPLIGHEWSVILQFNVVLMTTEVVPPSKSSSS